MLFISYKSRSCTSSLPFLLGPERRALPERRLHPPLLAVLPGRGRRRRPTAQPGSAPAAHGQRGPGPLGRQLLGALRGLQRDAAVRQGGATRGHAAGHLRAFSKGLCGYCGFIMSSNRLFNWIVGDL